MAYALPSTCQAAGKQTETRSARVGRDCLSENKNSSLPPKFQVGRFGESPRNGFSPYVVLTSHFTTPQRVEIRPAPRLHQVSGDPHWMALRWNDRTL